MAAEADIPLLDEATSALDSESDRLVQEAIQESGKGKSVISIAHVRLQIVPLHTKLGCTDSESSDCPLFSVLTLFMF
jgi:ABC-type transport system involved in cytochrome bd biosynthesis fused ATPase/permease subunit